MATKTSKNVGVIHYPFWFGGSASSMAACVTHPLDLVKVRLQTQNPSGPKRNMVQMFAHVFTNNGVLGLYKGLSASLLRQLTYSTTRFGVYEHWKAQMSQSGKPSYLSLIYASFVSGFLGGMAGNPADVLNVRMQHDAALPASQRRNYKHAIDGLIRMIREEGLLSIWRGIWPNSMRAALMTTSQLASYDTFNDLLKDMGIPDGSSRHFTASTGAGFVATTICSPVDVIKTRIMSAQGKQSITELLANTFKSEGMTWMFRGWVPSFIRLGPQTICTMMFLEQHRKVYRRLKGLDPI